MFVSMLDLEGAVNELQWVMASSLYRILVWLYDFLMQLINDTRFDGIEEFSKSIYLFAGIFMLFRLLVSLLNYLVQPDLVSDKSAGGAKIVGRVSIALVLVVTGSNLIFPILEDIQDAVVNPYEGILFRIIKFEDSDGNKSDSSFVVDADLTTECVRTPGSDMAADTISAFIDTEEGWDSKRNLNDEIASSFLNGDCFGNEDRANNVEVVRNYFNNNELTIGLISALIGFFGVTIFVVILCVDVVVRSLKLLFLQMISPVAFFAYIDPKDKIFNQWLKTYASVYADLFIKLLSISFMVNLFAFITSQDQIQGFERIFYLIGILVFVKALPDFVSKIFGISGAGSFKESANMLKKGLGLGAGAVGAIGAGALAAHHANKAQRAKNGKLGERLKNAEGFGGKAKVLGKSFLSGVGQTGRAAKMMASAGIKGAGAGFQGKGASGTMAATIAEGQNLATAIEGGAGFGQRTMAAINKATGLDLGGSAHAKEQKEAVDKMGSKMSDFKNEAIKELRKKNINDYATEEMKLNAMEEANKNADYRSILREMGMKADEKALSKYGITKVDGTWGIGSGDDRREIGDFNAAINEAGRKALVEQRTKFSNIERDAINALASGAVKNSEGQTYLSQSPELSKMAQEINELAINASNLGATDFKGISISGSSSDGNLAINFGDGSTFKSIKDATAEVSRDLANKMQTSGAGAARTYVDNKKK